MKKVAIIIAHNGFRDEEYFEPLSVFTKKGYEVTTFSSDTTDATSKFGKTTPVDKNYKDLKVDNFDAIAFIGGPGTVEYLNDPTAHKIANDTYNSGKILAAICMAPVILANAGLLKEKKATCFIGNKNDLLAAGANYIGPGTAQDGNIITADGPTTATVFAEKIIASL